MSNKLIRQKRRSGHIKRTGGERVLYTVVFVLFALLAATYLFALVWIFINSLKGSFEFAIGNAFDMPKEWLWSNYLEAIRTLKVNGTSFLGMWWNTIWLTFGVTFLSLLSTIMCSYAYARYDFPGRKALYVASVIIMTLSLPSGSAAAYRLYTEWGLTNSPLFLIGSTAGLGTNFIMFTSFYRSVSWEYAESAFIDGANDFQTWLYVILPQAYPLIGTVFVTSFIAGINDYTTCMLYMTDYPNIAYGLYEFAANSVRAMNYPVYFAGLVMAAIPGLFIFITMQDSIMKNMNIGGLKG